MAQRLEKVVCRDILLTECCFVTGTRWVPRGHSIAKDYSGKKDSVYSSGSDIR